MYNDNQMKINQSVISHNEYSRTLQDSYPQNEAAYHDIYPLWMGGILDSDAGCISASGAAAPDDAKVHRASPSFASSTPWINYWPGDAEDQSYARQERGNTATAIDMDTFYKLPPSAEENRPDSDAIQTADNQGSESLSSPNGVPKHCRFNSSSASIESSDEAPKFSHTLQFQMAQHMWENGGPLCAQGSMSMEALDDAQCQGGTVANMGNYTLAPDGEGTYSSSLSSSSSVRASSHSDGVLYPYPSPSRSASFSLNPFVSEFSQPDFSYKVPIVDCGLPPNKTEEDQRFMAAYHQRWGPHHHHHMGPHEGDAGFCDGGPMGMYPCPFGGCPKIGVAGGLDPLEFQTGFAMMSPAGRQDVKHEAKSIVRRSRYQLNRYGYILQVTL